ncbi:MAG: AsmA family protein [Kiloniellaceae bacterium]|nr:AsmA family protein [Kiloniellaceae bacterium]
MKLKRIVTGIAALSAAVAVAGYAIIASLDVQQVADYARAEVKAATGRDLTIAGPVELAVSLTPSILLQDVGFANAEWGSRPALANVRRLEVEVALLPLLIGDVVVKRLVAVEPDILLEIDAEGRGNWEFEEAPADAAPAPGGEAASITLPDVQEFRIEGGLLRLVDAAAGETLALDVTEAVGSLPSGGGVRQLRLTAAYNGHPFTAEGSYGGLPALLSGAPGPVDVTLRAGGATFSAKGTAGDLTGAVSAELAVRVTGDDLSGLSPWAGAELPALGPYDLSSNVRIDGQGFEFSGFVAKLGSSDLTGNLGLSLAGERPTVQASLVSKLLDLADFSGAAGASGDAAGGSGSGGGPARVFSDTPLPLAALRAVDAQVKLHAERLRLVSVTLEEVQTVLALKAGDLTLEPLVAKLAGGSLAGRVTLAAAKAEPELALRLEGKDVDFGDLLKQAEVTDQVGGALEFEADVKGRGTSPHAIASTLGGHVQSVALDGTIDNSLLRVLSFGLGDIIGPLFGSSEKTRLECFVTRFDIEGGQAKSRALVLDSGAFAVAGRGGIDLGEEQVNLAFDTETSQPSLASLAVPFRVTGPLGNPRATPDPVGAAVGVVGTVGDVAKTGGNIVGGAVDAVGGIIGTGPIIGQIGSNQTLCGEALAAIGRGTAAGQSSGGGASGGLADDVGKALNDAGDEIEKGFKSLFGN